MLAQNKLCCKQVGNSLPGWALAFTSLREQWNVFVMKSFNILNFDYANVMADVVLSHWGVVSFIIYEVLKVILCSIFFLPFESEVVSVSWEDRRKAKQQYRNRPNEILICMVNIQDAARIFLLHVGVLFCSRKQLQDVMTDPLNHYALSINVKQCRNNSFPPSNWI